jgi:hypothetical protein
MQRLTSILEQLKRKDCRTVTSLLTALTKNSADPTKQKLISLLRRWKQIDVNITESANEAKDNVKYLFTLERFIEPLYSGRSSCDISAGCTCGWRRLMRPWACLPAGTPTTIIDTLPALMNSIKMIHTIARYYNTNERMTSLFAKITDQMIKNCKNYITGGGSVDALWDKDPGELVRQLEACNKLNDAYQEQYKLTKKKLNQMPKGKQFDFSEDAIFGRFNHFCRRVIKLIDMFSTLGDFNSLSQNKLEGMEPIINNFHSIVKDFRLKRHDLVEFTKGTFDRDYVEFNFRISTLESQLQSFINQSFETIKSIEHSLNLLRKFQSILARENLKSDLDSKLNIIFGNYGMELDSVQQLYEKQKHDPPIPRNLPPVAGNITWSRHLLKRIEEPMKQFERNQLVLAGKDAKRIIKIYNKVRASSLPPPRPVPPIHCWYQPCRLRGRWWRSSSCGTRRGCSRSTRPRRACRPRSSSATPTTSSSTSTSTRRSSSSSARPSASTAWASMCVPVPPPPPPPQGSTHRAKRGLRSEVSCSFMQIPESAKIALFQEEKFKTYYNELHWALSEYDRVVTRVIPVTAMVLRPHFKDMEFKLRPGMVTLTWTSMNIESYVGQVRGGLQKLEELVNNINDIIENRIEKSLKIVSKTLLVDLPEGHSFTVEDFVKIQEKHITVQSLLLQVR